MMLKISSSSYKVTYITKILKLTYIHTLYNQYQLCMKQYDAIAPNEVESKNGAQVINITLTQHYHNTLCKG